MASDPLSLPNTFLAYPSADPHGDHGARLAVELRERGVNVTDWQDAREPGLLWSGSGGVKDSLDSSKLVLADVTSGNPNVLFELGYAIGSETHVYPMLNSARADAERLRVLDTVRTIGYYSRPQIIEYLSGVKLDGPTYLQQHAVNAGPGAIDRLFFLPAPNCGDLCSTIDDTITRVGVFDRARIDTADAGYTSLSALAHNVASAQTFVGVLLANAKGADGSNAHTMLVAGIAAGLGRRYVVLAPRESKRLLDLEDHIIFYSNESEAEQRLGVWLRRNAQDALRTAQVLPAPQSRTRRSQDPVHLGSGDARADFDLPDYFVRTPEFAQALNAQKRVFVGDKGSGKTANYVMLLSELSETNTVLVAVQPSEWEFPELAAVFEEHFPFAHWSFVYGSFWRFLIITEVMRAIREDFMGELLQNVGTYGPETRPPQRRGGRGRFAPSRPHHSVALKEWIDANTELLDLDFATRVTRLLDEIVRSDDTPAQETVRDLLQTARLHELEPHIKDFAQQHEIRLVVDDLDRNWEPRSEAAWRLILSLLNAIQDVAKALEPTFKPTVFIRRDVYDFLISNDPEFGRRDVEVLRWTPELLEEVVVARLLAKQVVRTDRENAWGQVFPTWYGDGPASEFIAIRSLHRPRQMIHFCQEALTSAARARRMPVEHDDFQQAWESTGELILGELSAEHRTNYPGLADVLIWLFGDLPPHTAASRLQERIIDLEQAPHWLDQSFDGVTSNVGVLYRLSVIGVEARGGTVWYKRERRWDEVRPLLEGDYGVLLHPAFHRYFRSMGSSPA